MTAIPVLELLVSTRAGGGPQHVLALATGLRDRGFAPIVAGPPDGPLFGRFLAAGLEMVEVRADRLAPGALARVVRLVRARGVRLVHSHGKGAGLYGRLAARACGVPAVHTFHGLHYERYRAPVRAAYLALERALGRLTTTIINVSRAQEAEARALGLLTSSGSAIVVNGVDAAGLEASALPREAARVELGLEPDAPVVGTAARFDPVKGLDTLVLAALGVPGATTVVIGDGAETAALRALAGADERVRFPGEIPEAWRLFRAFDVYVSTSRKEGLPLAVLEAMALGLPVVATDIVAHREVLGPACEGLVEGTPAAFAVALRKLLEDRGRRRALGDANRERVAREFSATRMLDAVEGVYRGAIGV